VIFVMSGCAVQPPEPIRESIPNNPAISQVQQNISKYKGSRVRWGGEIYATQNRKSETELEIIARPLDNIAKPNADASNGRFMVIFKGFLEPSLFTQGRDITVIGKVTDLVTGNIGEYEYQYPVIVAESYYLWPQVHYIYAPYPRRYDPFYYDPWYPWYPWWYY
jgi:outer membrane lipoprotein